MEADKNLINYKKIIVNILFLLLFSSILININQDFPFYYNAIFRIATYVIISGVAVFYIHSLVLLPILQQESDKKKYKNYVFAISIIYFLFLLLFLIINKENFERGIFNSKTDSLIKVTAILFLFSAFPLVITVFLSYAYSAIFLGKKVGIQFLEFLVNLIIVGLFYTIAITDNGGLAILLLTIILIVFYLNVFYTTPLFVKKKQRKKYWFLIGVISVFYYLGMLSVFINKILSSTLQKTLTVIFNLFGVLCLTYILSFIYGYFRLKIKAKEQVLTLKLDGKESELNLLKSQVNPHFLFNTLNTLYATALEEGAPKTAESTAKLASLIRYMQEDINKDFIPLENEIKYLEDYILIQKLRCAIEPVIKTDFKNIENYLISPGLLIPFVENAFKYGINPSKESKLKVSVICDENHIHFECINSYDDTFKTYYKEQGFGIGIKNAKQRLELVYSKNHTFEAKKENNIFSVKINITVKA